MKEIEEIIKLHSLSQVHLIRNDDMDKVFEDIESLAAEIRQWIKEQEVF